MKVRRKRRKRSIVLKIRTLMIQKNIRQSDIAKKLGITPSAVNQVISGVRNTQRIKAALIQAGVPDIWLKQQCIFTGDAA
jgi:transcriptional regulator with XRE-family HTH domain